jgi:hypothetical protein
MPMIKSARTAPALARLCDAFHLGPDGIFRSRPLEAVTRAMNALNHKGLCPHLAAATHPAVSLLVDQNPESGRWRWKRDNGPWRGSFATEAEARADATKKDFSERGGNPC